MNTALIKPSLAGPVVWALNFLSVILATMLGENIQFPFAIINLRQ